LPYHPSAPDTELFDAHDGGKLHRYDRITNMLSSNTVKPGLTGHLLLTSAEERTSVAEVLQDAGWKKAMDKEMGSAPLKRSRLGALSISRVVIGLVG
jgi:hypothetical protein